MVEFVAEHILPIVLLVVLPLAAVGLRVGAKKLRAYTRSTPTKADDQLGEVAGDALDGVADAIHPEEDK